MIVMVRSRMSGAGNEHSTRWNSESAVASRLHCEDRLVLPIHQHMVADTTVRQIRYGVLGSDPSRKP